MILIPQIYIKNGKTVKLEGTTSAVIKDDPYETAKGFKDVGAEAIHCIDLEVPHVGISAHVPMIKKIHDDLGMAVYVGGGFKTIHAVEGYIHAGMELVAIGSVAYQQPQFLEEASKKFPARIATYIDVKNGRVTIPGYAAVTNKTALDYAARFIESGVRFIFYSDVAANGFVSDKEITNLENFCKQVTARIICTSEISGPADIEKIAKLGTPRLDGLVLARALYEARIDLRGSIAMVNELALSIEQDVTLTEM
jgi:phosphoribosylformimino-5-aminoimidazole carboxamide ribotide isomerase